MSTLTLSLVQTNLAWEDKAANLQQLEQKIRSLSGKTELVILPEMFSTGFSMRPGELAETMEGPTVQWMKKLSAECRLIITGSLIIEDTPAGAEKPHYYNRLIWMLPNGQMGIYDKRHRFAYAGEDEHYTEGHKRLIASVKGWKINLLVCYDLRFPVWARQASMGDQPEYDLLVYVANWPNRRIHAWKTLLQARAIENQVFVAGVNRVGVDGNGIEHSGHSMLVDPMGQVRYSKENDEDIFTITLQKAELEEVRSKLPFWKDADAFVLSTK